MIQLSTGVATDKVRITPSQKQALYEHFAETTSEYAHYVEVAHDNGLLESNSPALKEYVAAFESLRNYLYSVPGIFYDMASVSSVSSADFTSVYSTYDAKLDVLLASIVVLPDDRVLSGSISFTDKKDGTWDATVDFETLDGIVHATEYVVYYTAGISAPTGIDPNTCACVGVPRADGSARYTAKIEGLLAKSEGVALRYRFGIGVAIVKSSGVYLSKEGVYDQEPWRDVTFASSGDYSALNYWNLTTGDKRFGNDLSYVKADVVSNTLDISGFELVTFTEDQLSDTLNNLYNKTYPMGCVYQSTDSTSPVTLFGGSWASLGTATMGGATVNNWKRTGLSYTMWSAIKDLKVIVQAIQAITASISGQLAKMTAIRDVGLELISNVPAFAECHWLFETEWLVAKATRLVNALIQVVNSKTAEVESIGTLSTTVATRSENIEELTLAYATELAESRIERATYLANEISGLLD